MKQKNRNTTYCHPIDFFIRNKLRCESIKPNRQIEITKEEESKALTLVMKNFGFVAFSTKWMLHAKREIEKKKESNTTPPEATESS